MTAGASVWPFLAGLGVLGFVLGAGLVWLATRDD